MSESKKQHTGLSKKVFLMLFLCYTNFMERFARVCIKGVQIRKGVIPVEESPKLAFCFASAS